MFKTLRSKLITITVAILIVFGTLFVASGIVNLNNTKRLMQESCDFKITTFAEQINKAVAKLENNAKDLALMGEIFYQKGQTKEFTRATVVKLFKLYNDSIGGGIWFEPYVINSEKRLFATYALRKKDGSVVFDTKFEGEAYNYLNQSWYKEIKSQLLKNSKLAWSKPYLEGIGSMTLLTTVGAGIYDKGRLIGISTVDWEISSIVDTVRKMQPTPHSFALFADKTNDCIIALTDRSTELSFGNSLKEIQWYSEENNEVFTYNGVKYLSYVKTLDNGMILIINVPQKELFASVFLHICIMSFLLLFTSIILGLLIYYVLQINVNRPIEELCGTAKKIGEGNLDIKSNISSPREFAELAFTLNKMTSDIKQYIGNLNTITTEKEKIESELSIARSIQYSVLPHTFYPNLEEMEIYATMDTAKEVGGDFYDFFFINPNQFMFLIADVSGKGIPAALFMMTTKTLIKNIACEETNPKKMIEKVNNRICESNEQDYFVTLFAGITDIRNGKTFCINCGHNPPLLKRADGSFEYFKITPNLVLGAMENISYQIYETILHKDDVVFIYTDGITEALNKQYELYNEDRLIDCVNRCSHESVQGLLDFIKKDVKNFTEDMEQSDDMTMLAFKYKKDNNEEKHELTIEAKVENFQSARTWLEKLCDQTEVPADYSMKLSLIFEEIFLNIASYAYPNESGDAKIVFHKNGDEIVLTFVDTGIPYNPLQKPDPDTTLGINERAVGGLGIYMVKNLATDIQYEYSDNSNILSVIINFNNKV